MLTQSLVTLLSTDKCLAANMNTTDGVSVENICLSSLVKLKLTVPTMTVLSGPKKAISLSLASSSFFELMLGITCVL